MYLLAAADVVPNTPTEGGFIGLLVILAGILAEYLRRKYKTGAEVKADTTLDDKVSAAVTMAVGALQSVITSLREDITSLRMDLERLQTVLITKDFKISTLEQLLEEKEGALAMAESRLRRLEVKLARCAEDHEEVW